MSEHFNKLTPAEAERLALLAEECAEVILAVGKILRHGYESCHPDRDENNRYDLEEECGHVRYAMIKMCDSGDLDKEHIHLSADYKAKYVKHYLHYDE